MNDFKHTYRRPQYGPRFQRSSPLFVLFIGALIVAAVAWDLVVRVGL